MSLQLPRGGTEVRQRLIEREADEHREHPVAIATVRLAAVPSAGRLDLREQGPRPLPEVADDGGGEEGLQRRSSDRRYRVSSG